MQTTSHTSPFAPGQDAWAYSRFSTLKQADGDSSRRQNSGATRFATKHSLALHVLHDDGVSGRWGRNATAGQLAAFIDALARGELGTNPILLIENFDRLSRQQLDEAQALFLQLINSGVRIVTLHNEKVYQKPLSLTDALMALVEMDVARQFSDNLSMRVAADWERRRKTGEVLHRRTTPCWIRQNGTRFDLIPERVQIVREIFDSYLAGAGSQTIAVTLNQRRVPTWSHAGQSSRGWHATQIKNILRNRSLIGEFQPHRENGNGKRSPIGDALQGYFPSVFSSEEDRKKFFAVQDMLSRVPKRGKPVSAHWNLAAGLAFSAIDGSAMWGQKHSVSRQRTPRNYLKSRSSILGFTRPAHFVLYEDFEPRLLALLRGIDGGAFEVQARAHSPDKVDAAESAVARASRQVNKLRKLVLDDDDPSETLVSELKSWERALKSAKTDLANELDRRERSGAPKFNADELDLAKPADRARLHATICRSFHSIDFFRDEMGRDAFVAWLDDKKTDGFETVIDEKRSGPFSFWSPTLHRVAATA